MVLQWVHPSHREWPMLFTRLPCNTMCLLYNETGLLSVSSALPGTALGPLIFLARPITDTRVIPAQLRRRKMRFVYVPARSLLLRLFPGTTPKYDTRRRGNKTTAITHTWSREVRRHGSHVLTSLAARIHRVAVESDSLDCDSGAAENELWINH